jgi:Fur family transcriptional regulator, ferric uptake regulator
MDHDYSLGTVEVALTPQQRFEEFLQSKRKRITRQRRVLLDEVFKRHEHFDVEDLLKHVDQVGEKGGSAARATVYRTLKELVEAGLLREMALGGRTVYEHDYGYPQHDHLHCTKCNKLIEFSNSEIAELRDKVAAQHSFRVTGHRLIISGICTECRNVRRPTRKLDLV